MHELLRFLLSSEQNYVIGGADFAGFGEAINQPAGPGLRQWCIGGHCLD
ncbi:MAG: hypothetical protein OXL38_07790 [Gammaproteobacteria bacterium]|nr:hypothetical protein [Gammaproteobacteria bacterium]